MSLISGTRKLDWSDLPHHVRDRVCEFLGSPVTNSTTQVGGFSPGAALRVRTASGRSIFIKSVGASVNAQTAAAHRAEARVTASLGHVGQVPALLKSFDENGWVTLLYEDVQGQHPSLPWKDDELKRVFCEINALSALLTPAPPDVSVATLRQRVGNAFFGWRRFADSPALCDELNDPWISENGPRLAMVEQTWESFAAGTTLLHSDIRGDQILLTSNRFFLVDWAQACVGPAWVDLLFFLPSVTLQGGPPIEELLDRSGVLASVSQDSVTAVGTALAGCFLWASLQPPPPGIPTVRAFQKAQGDILLAWLKQRFRF